jgi:rod shape-determining protein MreC
VWNGVFNYDRVSKENERLRAELDDTRGSTLAAVDAEQQRQQLLALLNLDYLGNVPTVAARVVSGAPSNFDATIEINRGSGSGIKVGMPLVTGAGLVGNVVRVTGQRSVVRLLTDPTFAVGVSVPSANDEGIVKGTGPDRPRTLDLIDAQSKVGGKRRDHERTSRKPLPGGHPGGHRAHGPPSRRSASARHHRRPRG